MGRYSSFRVSGFQGYNVTGFQVAERSRSAGFQVAERSRSAGFQGYRSLSGAEAQGYRPLSDPDIGTKRSVSVFSVSVFHAFRLMILLF